MLTPADLSLWVPSRARPAQAARLLRTTLPTATIVVAEPEAETYLAHGIPPAQLADPPEPVWAVAHPQLDLAALADAGDGADR